MAVRPPILRFRGNHLGARTSWARVHYGLRVLANRCATKTSPWTSSWCGNRTVPSAGAGDRPGRTTRDTVKRYTRAQPRAVAAFEPGRAADPCPKHLCTSRSRGRAAARLPESVDRRGTGRGAGVRRAGKPRAGRVRLRRWMYMEHEVFVQRVGAEVDLDGGCVAETAHRRIARRGARRRNRDRRERFGTVRGQYATRAGRSFSIRSRAGEPARIPAPGSALRGVVIGVKSRSRRALGSRGGSPWDN